MDIQTDQRIRCVALSNLRAMCERVSGMCHSFDVDEPGDSARYVRVTYSNPDEYGCNYPMTALYPIVTRYPDALNHSGGPLVALHIERVEHDSWDGEGWQAFQPIEDCPELWRNPKTGGWATREEIEAAK